MNKISDLLMGISVITVILAMIGAFATEIWLAPTQWLLVSAVLAIYALYFKLK